MSRFLAVQQVVPGAVLTGQIRYMIQLVRSGCAALCRGGMTIRMTAVDPSGFHPVTVWFIWVRLDPDRATHPSDLCG
jgi:hypothetical protein